ncbi:MULTISPECIES: hypothetical protein [unclassified Curtobacterium]|uniref:hypothetical protein n=1 Tax=unclassified Curtobacterium TaxID=257496 RepID=UPI00034C4A57|nr:MULTISPECIES: hypothetical protein [unclassified Curtobacterium]
MPRFLATPTWLALWAGTAVLVAGVVVWLSAPTASFGWFAYAPLAGAVFDPVTHSWQQVVGPVLILVGAVVAAFALGRLSVRRPH